MCKVVEKSDFSTCHTLVAGLAQSSCGLRLPPMWWGMGGVSFYFFNLNNKNNNKSHDKTQQNTSVLSSTVYQQLGSKAIRTSSTYNKAHSAWKTAHPGSALAVHALNPADKLPEDILCFCCSWEIAILTVLF